MAEALSYQTIRSANQAREADELKTESRKKNLLILVLHYLNEEGYLESAQALEKETNLDLNRYEVCDNVDLQTVLMEYESYYYIKFSRYPKVTKKLTQNEKKPPVNRKLKGGQLPTLYEHDRIAQDSESQVSIKRKSRSSSTPQLPRIPQNGHSGGEGRPKSGVPSAGRRPISQGGSKREAKTQNGTNGLSASAEGTDQFVLQGLVVHGSNSSNELNHEQHPPNQKGKVGQIIDIRSMINDATRMNAEEGYDSSDRMLKPLGGYVGYSSEMRELAQVISRDIFMQNPNVRWDDIIGLDAAKRLVKEAVVYPIRYPQLFTGILSPWKGLLLYGPPGTGKTLLAKAVATECKTTFFNISASSIVSKWRGDSEKLVRVLFEMARFHAPSTIFLDELESLMSQRGSQGGSSEHEGSRRMKTELLVQMDGLAKSDDLVFLLAASNLPWELDHAMLRRLEKRILVDLPTSEARKTMVHHYLPPVVCHERGGLVLTSEIDYAHIAKITEGYSGSDLRLVCKEAAMRPVRKIFDALENHTEGEDLHINLDTVTTHDIEMALQHTKPSARLLKDKYAAWQKEYESV